MTKLLEEFKKHPFRSELGKREAGFDFAIDHIGKVDGTRWIIETGTARIQDNWAGDGQSTIIWDWCIDQDQGIGCISIDINLQNIINASKQTKHVMYGLGDSVFKLRGIPIAMLNTCRFLYLDSFDWSEEDAFESAFHHMAELAAVWAALPKDCLVMVDDCHDDEKGKHVMVKKFFEKMGIAPAYVGYQMGWVKE